MTALGPARAWYSSTTSRSDCPRCWAAKGMTVVVPPNAAETVALRKSSAVMNPEAESCSMWQWLSIPPGSTSLPVASTTRPPSATAPARSSPRAAIRPSRIPTSQRDASAAVTTVPPRITMSYFIAFSPG